MRRAPGVPRVTARRVTRTPPRARPSRPAGTVIAAPFVFGLLAGAGLLVAWSGYRAVTLLSTVLVMLTAAALLTVGEHRIVLLLEHKGVPRRYAVLLVVLAGVLLAVLAVLLLVPFAVRQFESLASAFGGYLDTLRDTPVGRRLDDEYDLSTVLGEVVTPDRVRALLAGVFGGLGGLIGFVAAVLTTGVLTIYLLAGFDRIARSALRAVPASRRPHAAQLGAEVVTKIGSYIVGVVAIAVCAGTTALLFMLVAGIPYALVLALIVAALDTIPQIGATLGAVAVVIVALSQSFAVALVATAFFIVYQQIENWLIYPRVMAQAIRVSGLAALLAVLVGTAIAGVFGALVAVPAYAAASIVVRDVFLPRLDAR